LSSRADEIGEIAQAVQTFKINSERKAEERSGDEIALGREQSPQARSDEIPQLGPRSLIRVSTAGATQRWQVRSDTSVGHDAHPAEQLGGRITFVASRVESGAATQYRSIRASDLPL